MKLFQAYTNIIFKAFLILMVSINFDKNIIVFASFFAIILAHLTELTSFDSNLIKVQSFFRMLYKSYIVSILILTIDITFIFAVPIGLLIGMFSELEVQIKK